MRSTSMKINAQVVSCLKLLEFSNLDELPKMKEVKKKFLKIVKAKHPDGGQGTEEDFVELMEAKEFLLNYLKVNQANEEDIDEEETLARRQYEMANIEKFACCPKFIFLLIHKITFSNKFHV